MRQDSTLVQLGRRAWAALGVVGVAVVAAVVIDQLSVVVIPVVLAAFPASLVGPLATGLRRRGVPGVVVALGLLAALGLIVALVLWLLVPRFAAQLPALADALVRGVEDLEGVIAWASLPWDVEGLDDVARQAFDALADEDDLVGRGLGAVWAVVHTVTGLLLALVALFFYLKDGRRLWRGILDLLPARWQAETDELAGRIWWTLGAYMRGQLLVALVDAVFIGLGLVLLGVPLALPLAVLVFLGGLFPIVGAFVSGLVAVLVALADQGLTTALLVLAIVVVVQQVEGNVLEPLIMSNIIALHPLTILLAVTAGGLTLGILGAFLAVPVAASIARVVDHVRGREPAAGPGSSG